jgi:hypothetical protein
LFIAFARGNHMNLIVLLLLCGAVVEEGDLFPMTGNRPAAG